MERAAGRALLALLWLFPLLRFALGLLEGRLVAREPRWPEERLAFDRFEFDLLALGWLERGLLARGLLDLGLLALGFDWRFAGLADDGRRLSLFAALSLESVASVAEMLVALVVSTVADIAIGAAAKRNAAIAPIAIGDRLTPGLSLE